MSLALASILFRNSALFVADPISRFDPSCNFEADRGTADYHLDRHKKTPTSWYGCLCFAHYSAHPPLCEDKLTLYCLVPNSALYLLSLWLQTHGHTYSHILFLHNTIYSLIWWQNLRLNYCLTDSLQKALPQSIHNSPSSAPWKLQPGANLRISSLEKSGGMKWSIKEKEARHATWQLIYLSESIMTWWSISTKCICKLTMIVQFCEMEYSNIGAATCQCLPGCVNATIAAVDDDISMSYITILHCATRAWGVSNQDTKVL